MSAIVRTIHTDTYTEKSKTILEALRKYMLTSWGSSQMERNAALSALEIEPNGEIVWTVKESANKPNSWRSVYYNRSTFYDRRDDQKVREWIACSMKHIIYAEFRAKHLPETKNWKRTNKLALNCLTIDGDAVTVAEAYCLFDKLLNRKTFAKRWKKPMLDKIIGTERDPVATELEVARREESKRLDEQFETDKKALSAKKNEELSKLQAEVYTKYAQLETELKAAYLQSKKDLEDSLKFTTNLPDFLA